MRPSSSPLEDVDRADRPGPAKVMSQADLGAIHLIDRMTPELLNDLIDLGEARGAHRMSLAEQAAARVDRKLPVKRREPIGDSRSSPPFFYESQIFDGRNLGNREAIVHLRDIDIARGEIGLSVGLLRGGYRGLKRGQVRHLEQRRGTYGVTRTDDINRSIGELGCPIGRTENGGGGAIADRGAVIESKRIADQP